jgi:hypothetical protein
MKARDFSFTTDDGQVNICIDFGKKRVSFSTEKHFIEMDLEELDELNTKIQDEYEN